MVITERPPVVQMCTASCLRSASFEKKRKHYDLFLQLKYILKGVVYYKYMAFMYCHNLNNCLLLSDGDEHSRRPFEKVLN